MANKQMDCTDAWKLYEQGVDYNNKLSPSYYTTVNYNWRVYNLNHWSGMDTGGLPVFYIPITQRAFRQYIASIMSSSIKMVYSVENISDTTQDTDEQERLELARFISKNSEYRWEMLKMDDIMRRALLDGALSGDFCAYTYWDSSIDTGQTSGLEAVTDDTGNPVLDEAGMPVTRPVPIMGEFITELVDGGNVMFGNPNDYRVNVNGKPNQPYIIIAGRDVVSKLRKEAKRYQKENKLTDDDIKNKISADTDTEEQAGDRGRVELENGDSEYGKATYLIKLWQSDDGKIMFSKSVKNCYIRPAVDTELTIYPVAWGNWDNIKNSYHGQAVATGLSKNQIEIEKNFARLFKWTGDMAFPKIAINSNVLPNGITNQINEVIKVDANETTSLSNVVYPIPPTQISGMVPDIVMMGITQTMNLMGMSESSLGSAKPENTSALLVNAKNAAVPLQNVRANQQQWCEDIGYIWLDFMLNKYKVPRQIAINNDGKREMVEFDPVKAKASKFRIKIDVGGGGYFDEGAIAQTMDNLFKAGIADAVDLLKRYPNGSIPDKQELITKNEQKVLMQQQMQTDAYKAQVIQEFLGQVQGEQNAQAPPPQ